MSQAKEVQKEHSAATLVDSIMSLAQFLLILFFATLAIYLQRPPQASPATAPLTEFSSARAMDHLRAIAQKPHPIGSAALADVRAYILSELTAMQLSPQIQEAIVVSERRGGAFVAGTLHNIVARLKGTDNTKALMLAAHYDSVPGGPGAGDDGSGVAAMLEAVRSITAGPPLRNDIILLISDGEEVGLLGAMAFVNEHPWAKDVGLALNFEARGNGGPAYMFETSRDNGWLIKEFAKAAPYPFASSLSYEIYKLLPNDTDLTVFKGAGLGGLNFAFINGVVHYHSSTDNVEKIDERSIQHQGSYMVSLARHFGNLSLININERNAVYFNILGSLMVQYSSALTLPLVILTALLFVAVIVAAIKKGQLTLSGIALGFLAFLFSMIAAPLIVAIVWRVLLMLHPGYRQIPQGDTYNSGFYMIGFVTLTAALTSSLYILFRKKLSVQNLAAGAMIWWLILMILSAVSLPGAAYIFTWPLLLSAIALGFICSSKGQTSAPALRMAVLTLCAILPVILIAATINQLLVALTLSLSAAVMVVMVMLMGLLIPNLDLMFAPKKWALPIVLAVTCLVFIVLGASTSSFNADRPKPDYIIYGMDADTGRAIWATTDDGPDQWTSQFFVAGAERSPLPEFFPLNPRTFLKGEASAAAVAPPDLALLDDSTNGQTRTLRMRITSPRKAPVIAVYIDSGDQPASLLINGKTLNVPARPQRGDWWGGQYFALPEQGVELSLNVQPPQPVRIRLVDRSYDLPQAAGAALKPRPDGFIPAAFSNTDSTFVTRSFSY